MSIASIIHDRMDAHASDPKALALYADLLEAFGYEPYETPPVSPASLSDLTRQSWAEQGRKGLPPA